MCITIITYFFPHFNEVSICTSLQINVTTLETKILAERFTMFLSYLVALKIRQNIFGILISPKRTFYLKRKYIFLKKYKISHLQSIEFGATSEDPVWDVCNVIDAKLPKLKNVAIITSLT